MKHPLISVLAACFLAGSCNLTTPDQYFSRAALNCNLLYGFAGDDMQRDLGQPSVQIVDPKTMATASVKRKVVVDQKIAALEANLQKVNALPGNTEAEEMIRASKALYAWVLPVYKNEYRQLAALYDEGAPAEQIAAMENQIRQTYEPKFLELYNTLWTAGIAYARKHDIQVKEVNPSPPSFTPPQQE